MKKRAALLCAAALALAALTGCSGGEPERTAEEWTDLYVQAITNHGGEMVEYNPVISRFDPEDGTSALALESLGLAEEDMEAFGASVSRDEHPGIRHRRRPAGPGQDRRGAGGPPGLCGPAAEQL